MPIVLELPLLTPINAVPFLVVCCFALFDVIVGLVKAFATHTYSSTKMRDGLWHKAAIIFVTLLAYSLEIITGFMDFSMFGWENGTTLPIVNVMTAYIVIMEVGSILESIVVINPELGGKKFMKLFGLFGQKLEDELKMENTNDINE